jgi:hypothetical protein
MKTLDLLSAAKLFHDLSSGMGRAEHAALEASARVIKREAKSLIGHEQSTWPPLQPDTIARKANGDTPLLETGEM